MEYCPKCGNLLLPKRKEGRTVLYCSRCNYEIGAEQVKGYRLRKVVQHKPTDAILVIDKDVKIEVLPKARVECPKCSHIGAYYWEMQTRAGDEPATRFFKCVKCGHVWREYQ